MEGFQNGDRYRLLPACSHAFHVDCIDQWLVRATTCPMCRAEVDPRASGQDLM
ncbi:hypothetical protein MUK42_36774 [Musa troglodytarum]|uniref:RING-type E3 ubiquitin transferase n=1 Tax=Musa troglodytarum TaxID=320322 RepID=A0A9E7HRW6_9LILI|nr:hypothetical protein MUK42_36774 [Musa troglodytarum]